MYYLCILLHHVTHLLAFVYAFNVLLINTVTGVMLLTLQCGSSRFVFNVSLTLPVGAHQHGKMLKTGAPPLTC